MRTNPPARTRQLEAITFVLVGLSGAAAGLALAVPGEPVMPQLAAAVALIAWAGAVRMFLMRRSARENSPSLATMAVASLMVAVLVAADLGGQIAAAGSVPYELLLLILTRDAALTAVALAGNPVCLRLAGGLSVAVMLFASVLTEQRLIHVVMIAYALLGSYWLILLYWSLLEIKLVEGKCGRPPVLAVVVWGLLVALLTVAVVGPRQTLGVLAEWLALSGGTTRGDPDARGGVGDGPNLVKGTEHAQSTGPTDSDVFLETEDRSLYDASNEKWGEPEKPKKRLKNFAVAVESDPRESAKEKATQPNPAREFSVVRKRPRRAPTPSIEASAAYFVQGETPVHIRQVAFETFDGRRWIEPVFDSEPVELVLGFAGWLRPPSLGSNVWAGDRSYRVIVGKIDSPLVPLPPYMSGFRIDKVDRPSFFQNRQPGIFTYRGEEGLPRQTKIEIQTGSIDPARLRALRFRDGSTYALSRYLTLREAPQAEEERPTGAEPRWEVDPRVAQLAREWARQRPRGWRQVEEVLDSLRTHYRYEPGAVLPADTQDAVAAFLFDLRRGDDYAFASTACLMLRSLGYPCRFVEGFYAPPGRSDPATGQTPVRVPDDLHVWVEVMTPDGDWVVVEPTPGFEVLGPRQTVFARVWGFCVFVVSGVWNHPGFALAVVLAVVGGFVWWRRITMALVTLVWRLEFGGDPRYCVMATLRLLERRARIAGRRRPAGSTPRKWYPAVADTLDGAPRQSLDRLLTMADWALYAPGGAPPAALGNPVEIRASCRTFARDWTPSCFTAKPTTRGARPRRSPLKRAAALGLIGLALHAASAPGSLEGPPAPSVEPTAVSDLPDLPANVWADPPKSAARPAPRVAPKYRRLDPRDEMTSVERINDLTMQGVTAAWFFVMGAVIGSFLNVVIYRVPRGISVWRRRSHCPRCDTELTFRENMPIIGWLRLRGRCRTCREPISPRYPLVELATGLIVLALLQLELLTGGTSVPLRQPNAYAGVVWIIWYPKWDLIGLSLYHFLLLATLLCASFIAWDGLTLPRRLILVVGLVGALAPVIAPELHPVPPIFPRPSWLAPSSFSPRELVTAALGAMVGGLAGAWIAPRGRAGELASTLGLAGIVLGWQAAASIAVMTGLLRVATAAVLPRPTSDRLAVALGAVATLVQVLFWSSLAGRRYWPSHDSSSLILAGAAIVVGLIGLLARATPPIPRPDAEKRPSPEPHEALDAVIQPDTGSPTSTESIPFLP